MSSKRNSGLELLRLLLIFGVVVEHTVGQCVYVRHGADYLSNWCVCGFVFLTAWFGVKFNVVKCLKLVALGLWCAFVSNYMFVFNGGGGGTSAIKGYWFLWAYIILMCFAPIIEKAFASCSRKEKLQLSVPILFLVYGWCFLCTVPKVRDFVPCPRGVGGCSFLSLIGIYVMVGIYKEFDLGRFCTRKNAMFALPLCTIAMLSGFWWYWWIPAFVVTCFTFEFFRRCELSSRLERIVLFFSPSAFAVYLLHFTRGGLTRMSEIEVFFHEKCDLPLWLVFASTAVVTYICCLCLDIIRRGLLHVGSAVVKRLMPHRPLVTNG